jgi:cytochrome c oxidase subunit 1
MTWFRLPLIIWAHYAASIIMVLGILVLAIALTLIALERTLGIGVFDPTKGGDPLLFEHLFLFYSHPAVYIMILPGMGVISEVVSIFSRKRVFRLLGSSVILGGHLRSSASSSGSTTCSS